MKKIYLTFFLAFGLLIQLDAQQPIKPHSGEIYKAIEKLNFLGSALYIAAHPDDENTTLISQLSNGANARTAYLSLTRGDGGQNRIGTEIRAKLGLIRTHELVEARKIDGGMQFFTRANDFGYSKNADETLTIWNKDEVMHDIVKVIREFKPDIVINRFDHRQGGTHGHHTSSALLSVEAFDTAADPTAFDERLGNHEPWQIKKLFFNTGWWFYGSRENFEDADKSHMAQLDAGTFYPILGLSNNEISAASRTMHKSQGFGSTGRRGSQPEYLEIIKGEHAQGASDPFDGINTSWTRLPGGGPIGNQIDQVLSSFNFKDPSVHVNQLLSIYGAINSLPDSHWKNVKQEEVKNIIVAAAGLFLEGHTPESFATPNEVIDLEIEATNRSATPIVLNAIQVIGGEGAQLEVGEQLDQNVNKEYRTQLNLAGSEVSNPYWLNGQGTMGMYEVEDHDVIGSPVSKTQFMVNFDLSIAGTPISITKEIVHKSNHPVAGEVYRPLYVVPEVSVGFTESVYVFPDRNAKEVTVVVKSFREDVAAGLSLRPPPGWIVSPRQQVVQLKKKGSSGEFTFSVKGPVLQASGEFGIVLTDTLGNSYDQVVHEISYDHLPSLVIVEEANAQFERISVNREGDNIAYIPGAGDDIPNSLRQIGYNVDLLEPHEAVHERLVNYDAVIVGIRAFNTKPELKLKRDDLLKYTYQGGTVIVQYNTSRGIGEYDIGPYMLKLSRERVTDENAEVIMDNPDHEVLNYPNKITTRDFGGWVQERGLYFSNEWDFRYEAPISSGDPDESLKSGGLLITQFGAGHFIYTGYSWFRQLPAGVAGAYRLFANLVSIGKNIIPEETEDTSNER